MSLSKRYNPRTVEPRLQSEWEASGVYYYDRASTKPVYSIDTPPATVSGHLHLGHVYSYSHPDFMARFWRMNGYNVFYPMGYDDNGLPTGRLVEKLTGRTAREMERQAFVEQCRAIGGEYGAEYETLWKRMGLSVDWRHTYRTIDDRAVRISQHSFIELYEKGRVERRKAPTIWCPECGTAIAQAELDDLERTSTFYTLAFKLTSSVPLGNVTLPIATTRPELLPACVAVFVHPGDDRYRGLVGQSVTVPLFGQSVPLLEDPDADPDKGTGAVMCCTFGDVADVGWWYTHKLPLVEAIDAQGHLTRAAGDYAGQPVRAARQQIVHSLHERGLLLDQAPTDQTVRVHERCDTPVEYIVTPQWFLRVLDFKQELLQAGEQIAWHPTHMKVRYSQWVENLGWDWCLSRQRAFGVPFPVWYCQACGQIAVADSDELPVDPQEHTPSDPCACGSRCFTPEQDVMDTWATSSLTPQIAGRWLSDPELYRQVYPMSLRAQAHEIIRTWAFYTIVKSFHHFGALPWKETAISGWAIAGEGMGKISKSRGGGPMGPLEMIEQYSADAVRYWAASTSLGKDAVISETKVQMGAKLVNKLWNVARFSQRFLLHAEAGSPAAGPAVPADEIPPLSPADRWILARTQQLIRSATTYMHGYDYAAAKSETESYFWAALADNYLEMAKMRLYDESDPAREGALYALDHALLTVLKLFAPFVPHVTERIYLGLFAEREGAPSIHLSPWPTVNPRLENDTDLTSGQVLVEIATAVRRFKSEHSLSLGSELEQMQLVPRQPDLVELLREAKVDLKSITRVRQITLREDAPDPELEVVQQDSAVIVALARQSVL
jgi:valyl-tRNA synthetase